MNPVAATPATGATLLAQADLLLGLARAFAPPTPATLEDLADLAALADDLAVAAGAPEPAGLAASLRSAAAAARLDGVEAWAAEHQRLFACNVACPINEAGYVRRDKGHILADVAGFYRAFGVALRDDTGERLDHLVAELEFMAALLVMLARAEAEGLEVHAATTRAALRAFGADHLGEWLPGFAGRLTATTGLGVHAHLAEALVHAWAGVVLAHGIDGGPGQRLPMAEDDPGTPYECGLGEAGQP